VANANQTFFIPQSIRRLRLSNLPQSCELASALRRLRISTFDDLTGASLRDLQRVSKRGTALFLELGRLIERARLGEFAVPPSQRGTPHLVAGHHRSGRISSNSHGIEDRTVGDNTVSESPTDEVIFIPSFGSRSLPFIRG